MPKIKVIGQMIQTGKCLQQTDTQTHTHTHTHGHYQTYYLSCYAVDKNSTKLKKFSRSILMCKGENTNEANVIVVLKFIANTTCIKLHIPYLSPLEKTNCPVLNSSTGVSSLCFFATNESE